MKHPAAEITRILEAMQLGEPGASEQLLPLFYEKLRRRAGQLIARERKDHTLQLTALVPETYLRLVRSDAAYQNRIHFCNAAALAMRPALIDHANAGRAGKRGGSVSEV